MNITPIYPLYVKKGIIIPNRVECEKEDVRYNTLKKLATSKNLGQLNVM